MIGALYSCEAVDKYTIRKTTEKTVLFKLVKADPNYDAIVVNFGILEDDEYYEVILMRKNSRTGCYSEGVRKTVGGEFSTGWVVLRSNPKGVLEVLRSL